MTSKKKKRSQSNLSRSLASSNQTATVQRNFIRMLSAAEIRRSVPTLRNHRHFTFAINLRDNEFKQIHVGKISDIPLEKCIAWCLGVLEVHREDIQYFLSLQKKILGAILSGRFDEATTLLDLINMRLGPSMWEISMRGAMLSIDGLDRKQEYLKALIAASGDNGFLKTLVINLVTRFDDSDTLESESRFFEQKIKRTFSGPLLHYLIYKLLPHRFDLKYDLESILNYEKDTTAVDIFQAFLDFLTYSIDDVNDQNVALSRVALRDLRQMFEYEALDTLAIAFHMKPAPPIGDDELEIVDLYTAGNYSEVNRLMLISPHLLTRFGLVEIWAKAVSRLEVEKNEGFYLLNPIRDIIKKTNGYEKSKAVILAYSYAMGMFPWFKELRYLLERETKYYGSDLNGSLRKSSLMLSNLSTPAKLQYMEIDGHADAVLANSITGRLFARMRTDSPVEPSDEELEGVEVLRREKFRAIWNLRRSHFERAITLLEGLTQANSVLTKQDASRNLVEAYRSTGQIERASKVYVEGVLLNPNLTSIFDAAGLADDCVEIIKNSKSIYIPITLSLYSRFVGDKYDAALKYSFERYLKNNGLSDPIEVAAFDGIGNAEREYFLRYVCIPEVMKLYLFFKTPQDIEKSRIEICRLLITSESKVDELLFEIKDRTRRLVLRDAVNQVQGSKIFSDSNFVTGPNSQAFRTLFERYVSLREQDFSNSDDEAVLARMIGLFQGKEELLSSLYAIHIPDLALNEKNSTFLRLVKLVRDEFAFGERGLNVYLSTRIRHGYFPNTIRKPLRDNALLATRVSDTSGYKTSKDVKEIFFLAGGHHATVVEQALIEFSTKFNELVDEVNDNWLRIFTVDSDISGLAQQGKSDGSLFNNSVSAIETYYLQSQLPEVADFSDFVALSNRWLWSRTEASLKNIRERITGDMRSRALDLLENFSKSLTQRVGIENLGDFPNAVARARNGLIQVFDVIPSWFTRATANNVSHFDLDIPIQIAKIAADVAVDFRDDTRISWKGSALSAFVDIFYLLFENCSSKSKLKKENLSIKAYAERFDDCLRISVKNECQAVPCIIEANERLETYRDAVASRELYIDKAQKEGGSGFVKLRRSLEKDLGFGKNINLGYVSPQEFEVLITIPLTSALPFIDDENTSS